MTDIFKALYSYRIFHSAVFFAKINNKNNSDKENREFFLAAVIYPTVFCNSTAQQDVVPVQGGPQWATYNNVRPMNQRLGRRLW